MSETIETKDEDFNNAAENITDAAENLHTASWYLRISYIIRAENTELSEIRTGVYKRAMLYNNQIMPFGKTTVENIKEFCDICIGETYERFKEVLKFKVKEANLNMQFCEITKIYHDEILVKFKKIQNKAVKLKSQMKLDDRAYNEKINSISLNRFSAIRSIFENKGQLEGDSLDVAAIDAMDSLVESINHYVKSIGKVAGFFEVLLSDLKNLNKRISSNHANSEELKYCYTIIINNAGSISKSCVSYLSKIPECTSNIRSVEKEHKKEYEKKNGEKYDIKRDKTYGNNWIQKVLERADKLDDYNKLPNVKRLLVEA